MKYIKIPLQLVKGIFTFLTLTSSDFVGCEDEDYRCHYHWLTRQECPQIQIAVYTFLVCATQIGSLV